MALNSRRRSSSSGSRRATARSRSGIGPTAQPRRSSAINTSYSSKKPSSQSKLRSVRIGDIDRSATGGARRSSGGLRRLIVVLGIVIALVCLLIVGGLALGGSSLFVVKNVEVSGSEHLTDADMSALAPIPEGSPIFTVDTAALERSIERDAWVADAIVTRRLPSTIKIEIVEREIGAVVEVTSADAKTVQPWAIAADGMWLMAIPEQESEIGQMISPQIYADAEAVLHIRDVPFGIVPEMGTYCTDSNVNNALAIVEGMTTDLADQVRVVSATDAQSTLLTLKTGVEIAFGTADNIREKERICLEIMEQYAKQVAYINVRVVDRPTWRGIEEQ